MDGVRSELRRRVLAAYANPATVEDAARALGESTERIQAATYYLKRRKLLKETGERGQYKLYQTANKAEIHTGRASEDIESGTLRARLERMARDLSEAAKAVEAFAEAQTAEVERLRRENGVLRRTIADLEHS